MKRFKRAWALGCIFSLFINIVLSIPVGCTPAQAADAVKAEKLLSGNTLGDIFPTSTQVIKTGAAYSWLTEGTSATEASIIATDHDGAADMNDGNVGPDGNYSNNTASKAGEAYGSMIYDLKSVYKVSNVRVWADCSKDGYMNRVEIYAGLDGSNYTKVGAVDNTNGPEAGYALVVCNIAPVVYAQYIKVIMSKDPSKKEMRLGEVAVFGDSTEAPALLSNNYLRKSGEYNTSTPKLATNATYQWIPEQPFVTEENLMKTDNDLKNDGAGGLPDLTDGSATETDEDMTCISGLNAQNKYGTVVFNLNDMYQISKIDVWTMANSTMYMDGYEVEVSTDGVNYTSINYTSNPNKQAANRMVNTPSIGQTARNAKYVKIIMHNASGSQQLMVGEIAIWGWRLYDTTLPKNSTPERVEVRPYLKNFSTVYLDWSSYNHVTNNVNKYSVYIEKAPFKNVMGRPAKFNFESGTPACTGKYCMYLGLEPQTTYYIAVAPTNAAGVQRNDVAPVKITTPAVFAAGNAGDIFAVNDTPDGAYDNYTKHGNYEKDIVEKRLAYMRELGGINKSRWWGHSTSQFQKYADIGVGWHLFYHGPSNVLSDNNFGAWTFSSRNEPDLKGTKPEEVLAAMKENYGTLKSVDSRNLLCEPSLGGTEQACMDWLEKLYKSDGKNGQLTKTYFDVLDVHPYCKAADGHMPELLPGAPEMLIQKIKDLRALMKKFGDEKKPIMFTEMGWSTYGGGSYLRKVDRATQRNYLARMYMHAVAGGIKAVHWYNFADDGPDYNNLEHNLGLVDWFGIPKKSYYGYYIMTRVLYDAKYLKPVENVSHPNYGYEFWHEEKNSYITSLWAANEVIKTATLTTADTGVTVVGIDGSYNYLPVKDGVVNVSFAGAPVFIYSATGVKVQSIGDSFTLKENSVDVKRGDVVNLEINRGSMGKDIAGHLEPQLPSGWQVEGNTNFDADKEIIPMSIRVPLNAEEKTQDININVVSGSSVVGLMKLSANVLESIRLKLVPEPTEQGKWNQWSAAVYLENMVPDVSLSGTLELQNTVNFSAGEPKVITFDGLEKGKVQRITIPITELPQKAKASIKVEVKLNDGYTKVLEKPFNFTAAVNDGITPVIDGTISKEEWQNAMPIELKRQDQNKIKEWGGEADLSAQGYIKWDKDNLYMAFDVKDNIHSQEAEGASIWQGDSIQFALDTGRVDQKGSSQNNEFGVALGKAGTVNWKWAAPEGMATGEMKDIKSTIIRNETTTAYEIAIPWTDIYADGKAPAAGKVLGFSMLINDNDGAGRRGYLEFMSGIGNGKDTQSYEDLLLLSAER